MTRMRLAGEPALPAKITVRAGGRKVVLAKQAGESARHILLKALVFALYVPQYPTLVIEPRFHQRYRPDLLQLDAAGQPTFWAECGVTGHGKLLSLIRTYPATHLVVAKQLPRIESLREEIAAMVAATWRSAPVDLVNVPPDANRFLGLDGEITVTFQDVTRDCFPPPASSWSRHHQGPRVVKRSAKRANRAVGRGARPGLKARSEATKSLRD